MRAHKDGETINKALRREVLAYTTDGIAQSMDKAKDIAEFTSAETTKPPRDVDYPTALTGINSTAIQSFTMHIKYNEELLYGRKSNASSTRNNDDDNSSSKQRQGRQKLLTRNQQTALNVGPDTEQLKDGKKSTNSHVRRQREFVDYAPLVE